MHKAWYKEIDEDDENGFAQWGGYMDAKKAKLIKQVREQQVNEDVHSGIFKGVAIFVNGHTKPSAEELKVLMAQHSGVFHIYQMPSTTHIIASNLPNIKINKLGPLPIVKPNWIEDCITLGRLLDYTKYLLYTNQSRTQPQINFSNLPKQSPEKTTINKTKTASDPSFLFEFYGNSRLHLIATLGAEFKQFVNDLRAATGHNFPGLDDLAAIKTHSPVDCLQPHQQDVIMHIDMDCFFVSVGLRTRRELIGKPVAVTHSKTGHGRANVDRSIEIAMYKERLPDGAACRLQDIDDSSSLSEIASCSYEARAMGVKNGMFMGQALKLCPELKAIPYDFDGYREVSKTLYTTIAEYTLDIEAVSCDEMFVNVTNVLGTITVDAFAEHLRTKIKSRTGCPCSTGFGANRLQARLATKRAKPDGAYHLLPAQVENYMYDMQLGELPGVGRATLAKMQLIGLETCGDVQAYDLRMLQKELGNKLGETIHEQAKGLDARPLQYEHERKSVSAEVNYGIRFQSNEEAVAFVERLAVEVTARLVDTGMKCKCVTLKVMVRAEDAPKETAKYLGHGVCDSVSRSASLPSATDDATVVFREARTVLDKLNIAFDELRGVGIQLSRLEKGPKMNAMLKSFLSTAKRPAEIQKETNEVSKTTKVPSSLTKGNKISRNVTHFFKATQKDRSTKKISKPDIDLSVLQELPDDIREEVIKEYNLQLDADDAFKSSQTPSTSTAPLPEPSGCATGTKRLRSEQTTSKAKRTKREQHSTKDETVVKCGETKKSSGFESLTHEDFMVMLSNWLHAQAKPLQVDVEMLGQHFQDLAGRRQIEKLHVYIKYLHRNISEKLDCACTWHSAYLHIARTLQTGMVATYGKKLLIPEEFKCCGGDHTTS